MKLWKTLAIAMSFIGLVGCAVLSPEYKEQSQALKEYHSAEVKLNIAKTHMKAIENQLEKAKVSASEAQLQRDAAKAELDKLITNQ